MTAEEDLSLTAHDLALRDTPVEMVMELAVGLEDKYVIATRYGYSKEEFDALAVAPWFRRLLGEKVAELEKHGFGFQQKTKMMAESLLVHAFHAAKASDSVQNKLDVAKYLAKLADLEPRQNQTQQVTDGFNIIINIPDYSGQDKTTKQVITIDGRTTEANKDDELTSQKPSYVRLPVFNEELTSGEF